MHEMSSWSCETMGHEGLRICFRFSKWDSYCLVRSQSHISTDVLNLYYILVGKDFQRSKFLDIGAVFVIVPQKASTCTAKDIPKYHRMLMKLFLNAANVALCCKLMNSNDATLLQHLPFPCCDTTMNFYL